MKSSWVIGLLIGSLALNLALAGFIVGQRSASHITADAIRTYPRWVQTLPDPRREELRPVVKQHLQSLRPHVRTLLRNSTRLHDAISAEPFDATALQDALDQLRSVRADIELIENTAFVHFVERLTPAERRLLADDLQSVRGHGRRGPGERRRAH